MCLVAQSCPTLCNPMDCSPPGSSVVGFLRQEYWSGVPCPSPGDLPDLGTEPASLMSPALAGRFFTISATGIWISQIWSSDVCSSDLHLSFLVVSIHWGFPGGARGKDPACQCRRHKRRRFNLWVGKIPWRRKWQPTPVFLPRESHEQRSLVSYRLRGCKRVKT